MSNLLQHVTRVVQNGGTVNTNGMAYQQKERIEASLAALETSIAATPGNAVALDELERRYANLRAQYDQAVRNRASAETGDVIESLSKGQRISVIEQAVAPTEPSSPNRPKIAALGVIGGLGMGFGFILLLELLNGSIRRPVDLVNGLEITPIATIPYVRTRGQVLRRRLIVLAVVLAVLIGLPAMLWYVDQTIRPLMPLAQDILGRFGLN